jgi:hypothetical protein
MPYTASLPVSKGASSLTLAYGVIEVIGIAIKGLYLEG